LRLIHDDSGKRKFPQSKSSNRNLPLRLTAFGGGDTLNPMKNILLWFLLLFLWVQLSLVQAEPTFWNPSGTVTPTPVAAPPVLVPSEPVEFQTATPTPVLAPVVQVATSTPTAEPGVSHKDPGIAALFSLLVPGAGQVYDTDPLKGVAFAAVFGVSLWQTIDNLQLKPDTDGSGYEIPKNEDLGQLFGLFTLVAYGFGLEDAYDGAITYNRQHYVSLSLGLQPMANASFSYHF
jgi:hypothetical protein